MGHIWLHVQTTKLFSMWKRTVKKSADLMVQLSMTLSNPESQFQGHSLVQRRISRKRSMLRPNISSALCVCDGCTVSADTYLGLAYILKWHERCAVPQQQLSFLYWLLSVVHRCDNALLKVETIHRNRIGQKFWPIPSTIGLSDFPLSS